MANNIAGMFNMQSPDQLRQEYLQQNMVSPAQMGQQSLLNQVVSMGQNAGAMMGSALNKAVGGMVPGEAESRQMDEIIRQVDASEGTMDQKFDMMADLLSKVPGAGAKVMALRERANELRKVSEKPLDTSNVGSALRAAANELYGVDFRDLKDPEQRKAAAKLAGERAQSKTDTAKPPPEKVISSHVTALNEANDAQTNIDRADDLINKIETGVAKYGVITNLFGQASTLFGSSTESELVKGDIESYITESVNAILNLAKGPQTDKDAARAERTILQNALARNDSKTVQAGLKRLKKIHERALRNSKQEQEAYERQYPTLKQSKETSKEDRPPISSFMNQGK